jgi:hypothetical protein
MFGKQLERLQKRARTLDEQKNEITLREKHLQHRLQDELCMFLEKYAGAKYVQFSQDGKMTVYFWGQVVLNIDQNIASTHARIRTHENYTGSYTLSTDRFGTCDSASPVPEHVQKVVRHIFKRLFPVWKSAVATRDFEAFECARALHWIAWQVGGQWPDIITGNFPL